MPALKLFGRRWLIASDDIPLWLTVPVLAQFIELVLLVVWLGVAQPSKACPELDTNRVPFEVATFGLLGTLAIVVFLEAYMTVIGFQGSILESKKRALISPLLAITIITYLVQLGFNVLLTVLLIDRPFQCTRGAKKRSVSGVLWALAWTTWASVIALALMGFWFFNSFPNYMDSSSWSKDYMRGAWTCCSCAMLRAEERKRQKRKSIAIGHSLASLFGHIDYTRSDFIVSFYLAMVMQRHKRESKGGAPADTIPTADGCDADVEAGKLVDIETLNEAVHYFRHAFAVYGWDLYVLQQGIICGVPKVCCTAGRKSGDPGCGALPGFFTPWKINFKVAEEVLSIGKRSLLFYRDAGQVTDVVPYIISVDQTTKSVVLAMRGATTLDENALDLMLDASDLDRWIDASQVSWEEPPPDVADFTESSQYGVHTGYMIAAHATLTDIQKQGVLRDALIGPTAPFAGYKLVVVGHSLGAAMAFLLSLRLRVLIPDLRCFCFSVPGCVASRDVCNDAKSWCTSIAFGQEFVPRYSATNLDRVRDEMVLSAARCRRSKTYIIIRWFWNLLFKTSWKEDGLFYPEDQIPEEAQEVLKEYRADVDADTRRRELLDRTRDLVLPGKLMYVRETVAEKVPNACCGKKIVRQYQAEWVEVEEFLKQGILLDTRLLLDHLPNISFDIMKELSSKEGDDGGELVSKAT